MASAKNIQCLKRHLPSFLRDLYRFAKNPGEQYSLWADYLFTLRETKFLRTSIPKKSNGRVALIVSMTDFVFQLKLEALLADGLRNEGWEVKVLTTNPSNTWGRRYFEAFGISDFLYWDDFQPTEQEKLKCNEATTQFLSQTPLSFTAVKSWIFEKSWIGPQILSSIARNSHKGAPDLTLPSIQNELRRSLPETLERTFRANHLLDSIGPSLLMGIESNYALMGPIVDQALARDLQFIQVIQPSREDAIILRRLNSKIRRMHPNSLTVKSFDELNKKIVWDESHEQYLQKEFADRYGGKWFLQSRNQAGVKNLSLTEITELLKLNSQKKTGVVFSHILWDANLFYGEDLFLDYEDWFVQTVRAACANKEVNWIIKLHPANIWKRARDRVRGELSEEKLIKEHVGKLPDHVKLLFPDTEISTKALFDLVDFGVTVRGTTGMELPCFGKRVFTAGTGRYSGFGFTDDSKTKEEYLNKLARIQCFPEMSPEEIRLAKLYAYGVFRVRPLSLKSCRCFFRYKKEGHHPLDHNLVLNVKKWSDIEKNGDLKAWTDWAASSEPDYLDWTQV